MSIVLAAPPLIGERQTSTHDCGPSALAASLEWARHTDTELEIVSWMHAHGRDESKTGPEDFAAYCDAFKIPYTWDYGNVPMSSYIPAALARGHVVIGLHQCDGGANPVPAGKSSVAHFRTFYGATDTTYPNMNPWPPSLDDTAIAALAAADLKCHFEVMLTRPTPASQPVPTPQKGDPMHLYAIDDPAGDVYLFVESGAYLHVGTQEDIASFKASGATGPEPLSVETHDVFMAKYNGSASAV